jgi:hypothetical protein
MRTLTQSVQKETRMANYIAHARTNEFKVRDVKAFTKWVEEFEAEVYWNGDKCTILFAESIPSWRYDEETEDDYDVDFTQELYPFLADGEVAVVTEVGHEKLRYLVGVSIAVNHEGDEIHINLDEIECKIRAAWGKEVDPM